MYDQENIFAKILRQEIPCDLIYEDNMLVAFKDITPQAPTHVLVIPKGDYVSFNDFVAKSPADAVGSFFKTVGEIAEILGLEKKGYRLITNHSKDGGQEVPHFHVHILGGKPLGKLVAS